ncbi:MAG: PQQ-binding-like beta-propeller repeat protein, partial [Aeromicrobium sp.]
VDGYALPSFEHVWTQDNPALFPTVTKDCLIAAAPGNSALLAQDDGDTYHLTQVDPATGAVLGSAEAPKNSGGQAAAGEFDLASASNQLDRALGMPNGDTIYTQVNGLTRHSLETGKVVWDLDLGQLELESTEEYPMSTVLPEGVTEDGYLVASVSNNTAVDIVAVDVETGELAARWAVPPEYRNGFQVEPGMTLFEGGLVLTRNFEAWEFEFAAYRDLPEPEGDKYDIGVFTFPEPDDSAATAVPVAGPTDTDAEALGGLATPAGAEGDDRHAGAFRTGSVMVAHAGNVLTGISPTTGKEAWTAELDPDPGAHVCVAPEPTQKVDTFLIAIRGSGEGARCDTVLNVDVADGRVIDRIALPATAESAGRIVAHEGVMYLITGDKVVNRVEGGALVPHATLANQPYYLQRTPQDPSLLISTSKLRDGREWAIESYRLPSFEPVWSTTASDVFSKVDRRNTVESWRGNGLWVSTTFGDLSGSGTKVKDSLALLDPATGKVVTRTGSVERDYLADDLSTFSLTHAISSGYVTAGFDDGTVVLPQTSGVMRYSLADQAARWTVDTSSIKESMERDRGAATVSEHFDVIDGGKTVLVTLSNNTSVELMTLDASDGTINGRWNVPTDVRNGLQAGPDVTAFTGGVALSRNYYSWDYAFNQSGREVPPGQQYDVGLFALPTTAAKK